MNFWQAILHGIKVRLRGHVGVGIGLLAMLPATQSLAEPPPPEIASPSQAAVLSRPDPLRKLRIKSPADLPECERTGQRVIGALARDDSGAANQFYGFYTAFKCPPDHLAQAFGCLVELQASAPNLASPSPDHVAQCWDNPMTPPPPPPPPEPAKPDEKK
jgi:hypothetical protein